MNYRKTSLLSLCLSALCTMRYSRPCLQCAVSYKNALKIRRLLLLICHITAITALDSLQSCSFPLGCFFVVVIVWVFVCFLRALCFPPIPSQLSSFLKRRVLGIFFPVSDQWDSLMRFCPEVETSNSLCCKTVTLELDVFWLSFFFFVGAGSFRFRKTWFICG